jgi:hypothetical protein
VVEADVRFAEPVYCYLEGPHYHWYAPPPQASFEMRGGAFWYLGVFAPVYYEHRPRYVVINDVYRPIQYGRPTVVVADAPSGWRGGPPGRGRVVARPVAAPQAQVRFGGIGIQMGAPPPAPTLVRERVYVGEPPGHAKRRWQHDDDNDDNDDDDHGKSKGKDKGHHKGKWKD